MLTTSSFRRPSASRMLSTDAHRIHQLGQCRRDALGRAGNRRTLNHDRLAGHERHFAPLNRTDTNLRTAQISAHRDRPPDARFRRSDRPQFLIVRLLERRARS